VGEGKLRMANEKGQFEVADESWGLLELVWPKPGMLPLGSSKLRRFPADSEGVHELIRSCRFIDSRAGEGDEAYKPKDQATY
jgi:hypothetical protein